MLVNCLNLQCD